MTKWRKDGAGLSRTLARLPEPAKIEQMRALGLDVRVTERAGELRLYLAHIPDSQAQKVCNWVDTLLDGHLEPAEPLVAPIAPPGLHSQALSGIPATLTLCLVMVTTHLWILAGFSSVYDWMIADPRWWPDMTWVQRVDALASLIKQGEIGRLVTPALLHFSVEHLTFNMLALYILGRPLERFLGSVKFLGACLFIAVFSNVAQALAGPFSFGGFSGVNYGLIGMVWVLRRSAHGHRFAMIPPAMIYFSVAFALAGAVGMTGLLGLNMANMAHFAGLFSGLMLATVIKKGGQKAPKSCEVP